MLNNKRAVSEMVAYTILIVIAIALSVIVYEFLLKKMWQPTVSCPPDISLVIDTYKCKDNVINITFLNSGNFNMPGFMIDGKSFGNFKKSLKLKDPPYSIGQIFFIPELKPGNTTSILFDYAEFSDLPEDTSGLSEVTIKPFIDDKKLIICENAVIKEQLVGC
jgi:hypothetical protein